MHRLEKCRATLEASKNQEGRRGAYELATGLVLRLLVLNPEARMTANDALDHDFFWTDPAPAEPAQWVDVVVSIDPLTSLPDCRCPPATATSLQCTDRAMHRLRVTSRRGQTHRHAPTRCWPRPYNAPIRCCPSRHAHRRHLHRHRPHRGHTHLPVLLWAGPRGLRSCSPRTMPSDPSSDPLLCRFSCSELFRE